MDELRRGLSYSERLRDEGNGASVYGDDPRESVNRSIYGNAATYASGAQRIREAEARHAQDIGRLQELDAADVAAESQELELASRREAQEEQRKRWALEEQQRALVRQEMDFAREQKGRMYGRARALEQAKVGGVMDDVMDGRPIDADGLFALNTYLGADPANPIQSVEMNKRDGFIQVTYADGTVGALGAMAPGVLIDYLNLRPDAREVLMPMLPAEYRLKVLQNEQIVREAKEREARAKGKTSPQPIDVSHVEKRYNLLSKELERLNAALSNADSEEEEARLREARKRTEAHLDMLREALFGGGGETPASKNAQPQGGSTAATPNPVSSAVDAARGKGVSVNKGEIIWKPGSLGSM